MVGILDSPPSYRKTLKYFRALWQTADPRSSFSFSRILGSPPWGTLRFPTEFGLFSRFILILNCSRGKFQQVIYPKINEIGHLLMVFSKNAGGWREVRGFVLNIGILL